MNKKKQKLCPVRNAPCLKSECEFYHKDFGRCLFDLLMYNIYRLATEFKRYNDNQEEQEED
jgi:hypothetical protein